MNVRKFKTLTRGTRDIIKKAINETKTTNRYELCQNICETLEERFHDGTFSYQLSRMNLEDTGEILAAIDTYMFRHSRNSDFGKEDLNDVENEEV